jgi:ABC-type transport system involved in multi-copper enzyme maturation permease subunit
MVVKDFPKFVDWLTGGDFLQNGALFTFCLIAVGCLVVGVVFGYLVSVMRHGPMESFYATAQTLFQLIPDFVRISPRRVLALARLAIKEAFRRKVVLAAVGIFAVALLVGGWFFNPGTDHPERTYIGIVTWGTQLLVMMTGLLIGSFSLPDDIKSKTIHTVVTKPVRSSEIILGRILGFAGLATAMLLIMATICLAFVGRGLAHRHVVDGPSQTVAALRPVEPGQDATIDGRRIPTNTLFVGYTSKVNNHRHRIRVVRQTIGPGQPEPLGASDIFRVVADGSQKYFDRVVVDPEGGHSHSVVVRPATSGNELDAEIAIGPATGFFRARVPLYASSLLFTEANGNTSEKGLVTGDVWTYRGYIVGGASLAKATFEYDDIWPDRFGQADTINLELTLGVERSHKGDINRRVLGSVYFESVPNPDEERRVRLQSNPVVFETSEGEIQSLSFPRTMLGRRLDENGNVITKSAQFDFFDEVAKNGKVRVVLRSEDRDQYLGVSRADVYFRAGEKVYWINFYKAFFGIWLQMLVVVTLAVSLSTFLSMPVTMFGTILVVLLGFVTEFIRSLLLPDADGGGPIESFIRMVTQMNMQTPLQEGFLNTAMQQVDKGLLQVLNALTYIVPDFSRLDFSQFVQFGYWIDGDRLMVATFLALSFCLGLIVFGYFNLKTREIAA